MVARITKTSSLTGITRTLQFPQYDHDDFERRLLSYERGYMTLEDAFPEASPNAREFIRSGVTEEEWQKYVVEGQVIPKM